ncbi:MAG: hypothetical protein Q7S38_00440 [bacterium]|nr:hypothetical protein [bacterium]
MQKNPNRLIIQSKLFRESKNMTERDRYFQTYQSRERREPINRQRILVTMPYGIGDAIYLGLSAVDQIVKNDPVAQIDVLCNEMQREMFCYDPRIHTIIVAERTLFPTPDNFTIRKALSIDERAKGLIQFLKDQDYNSVLPCNVAFRFAHTLGTKVLYPDPLSVISDYQTIRNFGDAPASRRIRAIINHYFDDQIPPPQIGEPVPLYIDSQYIANAKLEIANIRASMNTAEQKSRIVVVSPDTASAVTRPPTTLLVDGITPILQEHPETLVYILPSYTDEEAASRLYNGLFSMFSSRIQRMPSSPRPSLIFTSMVVDQADMLITGDTGIMHLAAATKIVNGKNNDQPRNITRVVAIFGGTNPGLYGYHLRTKIIGRGSKEQQKLRPGFLKEGYDPKEKNYFSHISPAQLTQAIQGEFDFQPTMSDDNRNILPLGTNLKGFLP